MKPAPADSVPRDEYPADRRIEDQHPDYPASLRPLHRPPPELFVRGRPELLSRPAVAVVGARSHSQYGRDATVSLVVGLARAGYVIVSGLARGIDGIAHRAALDVGGDTVAVLGCGLDVHYPPEHADLAESIARHGCVVSEFPPGTAPRKWHFPRRNRIIAALARVVLVVEAAERSGTLITVGHALELGKDVCAVPGPIQNPTSRGTHRLIQDGAALVTCAADVLAVLGDAASPVPASAHLETLPGPTDVAGSDLARRVWASLGRGGCDMEVLSCDLGAAPEQLLPALLELELAGLVRRLPGPRFVRSS